jgi:hypothetical protein
VPRPQPTVAAKQVSKDAEHTMLKWKHRVELPHKVYCGKGFEVPAQLLSTLWKGVAVTTVSGKS